jgi:F0F1-type ATP synthase assembly protein I
LWEQMLRERMKIKQARAAAERAARIERKRVAAQRLLIAQIVGACIIAVIFGILTISIIKQATR